MYVLGVSIPMTCLATQRSFPPILADLKISTQMDRMGIFERYGVKVLGTSIKTLETSEDRDLLYVRFTLVRSHGERRLELLGTVADRSMIVRKL